MPEPVVLFDDRLHVHYGQAYVEDGDPEHLDMAETYAGQENGLLGAAAAGRLCLLTATHTGEVPLRVELLPQAPAVVPGADVVEASFSPRTRDVVLAQWAYEVTFPLGLPPGDYRVRYTCIDIDAARREEAQDSYLLQLWPAPSAPDAVVAVASEHARYWHNAWT